jgi:hypothetical protein
MIDKRDMSIILTQANPPAPFDEAPPPARTIKQAIRNLERETDLLMVEARGRLPFHDTLARIIARMA